MESRSQDGGFPDRGTDVIYHYGMHYGVETEMKVLTDFLSRFLKVYKARKQSESAKVSTPLNVGLKKKKRICL